MCMSSYYIKLSSWDSVLGISSSGGCNVQAPLFDQFKLVNSREAHTQCTRYEMFVTPYECGILYLRVYTKNTRVYFIIHHTYTRRRRKKTFRAQRSRRPSRVCSMRRGFACVPLEKLVLRPSRHVKKQFIIYASVAVESRRRTRKPVLLCSTTTATRR